MNRFVLPLGGFGLLVVLLGVALKQSPEKGIIESPLLGKPAPAFSQPSLTEPAARVSSDDFKGQWHLLNVWGTWCAACRYEHPVLLQIQKDGKVPIVGIDWRDEDDLAIEWLAQLGNPYAKIATDHEGRVAISYGVYAAPESFLINPEGIVVKKRFGVMTQKIWNDEFLPLIEGRKP